MQTNHGLKLATVIEEVRQQVILKGKPIIVASQGTIELVNHSFSIRYEEAIDIVSIKQYMEEYYKAKSLNLDELQQLEANEYQDIEVALLNKFHKFDSDIHTRQVLWTDDCCISMIQYLIRDGEIICNLHLRSSDIIYKLFSDLYLIHKITKQLQDKIHFANVRINVWGSSMHIIAIKNLGGNVN